MMTLKWFSLILLLVGFGFGVGCQQPPVPRFEPPNRFEELFKGELQVLDLTHALSPESTFWPSPEGNPFHYEPVSIRESGEVSMGRYSTPEHHGTHLDAPVHSADGQPSVDQLKPSDLLGPAAVIDVSADCATNADYLLAREDITTWEARHGRLPHGAIVLMFTGFSLKYRDGEAYRNEDAEGRMHFPGFSLQAARFLIEERNIRGIGIDTLSVDAATAEDFPVHRLVNGAGKFHLENVAKLQDVPASGARLIVAPIKIRGGSGGQVRIFAVLP